MRFKRHILLILLLTACAISGLNAQIFTNSSTSQRSTNSASTAISTINHTVKMGETAYSIATNYRTTVEEIFRLNPGSDKGINVGQTLRVPQSVVITREDIPNRTRTYTFKHKIEAKETLFSVSQKYNITVSELLNANPGLSEASFSIGKEITIPDIYTERSNTVQSIPSQQEHKVEKQETLYSISKKYNSSIEEILKANPSIKEFGLRQGSTIYIPNSISTQNSFNNLPSELDYINNYIPQDGVVRIALLLPFIDGSKSVTQDKITEYYEGFLLAIQRMKERGLNAEIFTFDIGTDNDIRRLESILGTNELNSLNLIIGGVSDKQVQLISSFSNRTGIKYVVPFSNKNTGVESNKNIFQVANSHVNQYDKITRAFITRFRNNNIVFLTENGSDKNKMDFVQELQKGLKAAGINYKVAPTSLSITDDLNAAIDRSRKNIIIPTSSSEASLKRIMGGLDVLARNKVDFSLFGYPEWQVYINKTRRLHQYDSYIYSMFYLDDTQPDAQLFADRYKQWYNKSLVVSYPKFAHMGYDTGITFLTALQQLGHDFSSRISELNSPTLQSALYFEPVSVRGGYINTGMYFVNLRPDGTVEKSEISKQ